MKEKLYYLFWNKLASISWMITFNHIEVQISYTTWMWVEAEIEFYNILH